VVTDAIVESLDYDHAKRRISAVRVIDAKTQGGAAFRHAWCFCAPRRFRRRILLHSKSEYFPDGLANRS
jgi:hypothetical protein